MTFKKLEQKYGEQNPNDWHQHKNGGAWIFKDAKIIKEDMYIGPEAVIWGGVMRGGVMLGGVMWGGEMWGGVMRGGEMWGGVMWGGEMRGGEMRGGEMWGGVMLGGEMRGGEMRGGEMWGGVWETSMLFISGSKYGVSNSKPGHIAIGCECHPFAWWKKNGVELAKKEGFTKSEIAEYEAYVELVIKIGR